MALYEIDVQGIDGTWRRMDAFRGQVLLIVNVASACGFTPQYAWLEQLHRDYRDRGFSVLGFPCNQFGGQEPGTNDEILEFCRVSYDVTFPMFARVDVNGPDAHPLFDYLKASRPGLLGSERIKWNFTKFLVSADGEVVRRFGPRDDAAAIEPAVRELLGVTRR